MNVGQLKKALEQYPDDMGVVTAHYSDYEDLTPKLMQIVEGVTVNGGGWGGWVMRSHPTMSEENKARTASFLYLGG